MKKLIALSAFAFFLCSCAGVNVKKPEIDNVKRVAVVGVTSNEEYKDIESVGKEKKQNLLLTVAANVIKDNVEMITEGQVAIITHGAYELINTFNDIEGWGAISLDEVINNEQYKALFAKSDNLFEAFGNLIRKERYVAPAGMSPVLYETVHPSQNHWVNGERAEAPVLRSIGSLCDALGVDAVAVAEFTFLYKTGFASSLTSSATPIVYMNVALIDRNGNKVLYTDPGWAEIEGKEKATYRNGAIHLIGDDKSINAYNEAINATLKVFKKEAKKKLSSK